MSDYTPLVGDKVTITGLGRNAVFTGVVKSIHPNFEAAQEAYRERGPYSSILKKGKEYDADAPHLICAIDNKTQRPLGACVLDTKLKWREPADDE